MSLWTRIFGESFTEDEIKAASIVNNVTSVKGEDTITIGERKYIGSGTCWSTYPNFYEVPTSVEKILFRIWKRERHGRGY